MPGQLFTEYFLTDGIQATAEWRECLDQPQAFTAFKEALSARIAWFTQFASPNESLTEQDLVRPALDLLGWTDYLPQQGTERNEDIPDHLLFADADSKVKAAARANSQDRYQDALLIEESKRSGLLSTAETWPTRSRTARPTARFCGTSPPRRRSPTGASGGES